jgi:hypothetical protein
MDGGRCPVPGVPRLIDGLMLDPARVVEPHAFEVRQAPGELVTSDGMLTVHIELSSGGFSYRDARRGVVRR